MCENCAYQDYCNGASVSATDQKEKCISKDYSMFEENLEEDI